jgi:hypothetical protein
MRLTERTREMAVEAAVTLASEFVIGRAYERTKF